MARPERGLHLLARLDDFVRSPALSDFRREAAERFLGADRRIEAGDAVPLADYVALGHRDSRGRCAVDLFLESQRNELDAHDAEALARMRESVFGLFQVEEIRTGVGLDLRRCGTDERFAVADEWVSRRIRRGEALVARLVPYLEHHLIAAAIAVVPAETCGRADRAAGRDAERARTAFSDPAWVHRNLGGGRGPRTAPESRFEAELFADEMFTRTGFRLGVEEVQLRFRSMRSVSELLEEGGLPVFESDGEYCRFCDAIESLWHHTPRGDGQEGTAGTNAG